MTNKVSIVLEIVKDNVVIKVNGVKKKNINVTNKIINTKEIYELLKYKDDNLYELNCTRISEEETIGKDNEIKRLYNYVFDLFEEIKNAVNEITKKT